MTYPENPTALTSVGMFTAEGANADAVRDKLAAIGMQWFQQCQSDRINQERQWYLNLAFFYGNQHVAIKQAATGGAFELYVPKAPYYRVRIVVNQVRRVIRKEIARLTAQKPNAYVVPSTTEDSDVFAAQAGEQIWDSLWRRLKFNKTLREAVFWQSVVGNGFVKSYWDANKMDSASNVEGDICIENVTPFHIFIPDLMCTELEDQPYLIHAQTKSNLWIKQTFGIDVVGDKLESVEDKLQAVMGVTKAGKKKEQSIVLEVWVKPGYLPELPDGGVFTLVSNKIVQGFDKWPYDHGMYPFSKLDSMPTGKFYNTSVIEDLIPLQKELNRSRAQLIESKNKASKPQLMAEKGSVDASKITTEPGQVILYEVGFQPPQPLPLQGLPSYVTDEINRLYSDIQDLSGQHDVSNGSTPPGVTAATAISFLQEQDESLISTHFTSVEEAIEKIATQCLDYVKSFWDDARTVKIVGAEGTFDVQSFKGSDLRGNGDIRVESGSALPTSRAAKQAFIMDLMTKGFIPPDEGLEMMEVGGIDKIYERIQVDKRQAQRENLKMRVITDQDIAQHEQDFPAAHPNAMTDPAAGLPLAPPLLVSVNTWDNHDIHIQVHNDYRKSQYFDSMSPTVKQQFEAHVQQHMDASANVMMHPLTGAMDSTPNSPNADDEQATAQDLAKQGDTIATGTPGPVPSPDNAGEDPSGNNTQGG
jgi:hypothetical protein